MTRAILAASILGDTQDGNDRRYQLRAYRSGNRIRWYGADGEDTEVSGGNRAEAKLAALAAWGEGGFPWYLEARWERAAGKEGWL